MEYLSLEVHWPPWFVQPPMSGILCAQMSTGETVETNVTVIMVVTVETVAMVATVVTAMHENHP